MSRMLLAWWFLWQTWVAMPESGYQLWRMHLAGQMGPFVDQAQCDGQKQAFVSAQQARQFTLVLAHDCWDSWASPVIPPPPPPQP